MNTIQGTLGQVLLVLVGLAVVLFAVILLLVEADYILRLGGRLARRWKHGRLNPNGSNAPATNNRGAERVRHEHEVR